MKSSFQISKIFILTLIMVAPVLLFAADTPEQVEQFKYAMGLIQRQLHEEAGKVLTRLLSEPQAFSQIDSAIFWLAECEYRQKNYTNAIGFYTKLLKDYPSSPYFDRAAYGLGWTHTNDNNPKSASEAFAQVSRKDTKLWVDTNMKRGHLMARYNLGSEGTIRVYEELLKEPTLTEQQKYECHLQIGIGKFNQSIYRQALEHLEIAIKLAPKDKKQAVQFYIAESYFRIKSFKEASSEYAKTIALAHDSQLAQKSSYSLAWCYIKLAEPKKALLIFEKQAFNKESVVNQESLKNLVDLLMNMHKYEEAVQVISKGLNILDEKERPDFAYFRSLALSRIGEYEKSLTSFSDYLKKHPKHSKVDDANYQKGLVNVALGRFKKAIYDFEKVSSDNVSPDIREKAIYRIGECWFNLGNITQAGNYFNRVIKDFPKGKARFDALYQIGELAYMQNSYADALTAFDAIAATKSELAPQANFRAGEVLMRSEQYNDAVKKFQNYLDKNIKGKLREDAIFKIGLCWLELKDQGQALAAFSQLLDAKGYFRQEARFNIAEISRSLANYPLAIQHYKAIIAEEPTHPLASRARRAIGISLYNLEDYPAAIETFTKILKDYPTTDEAIPETRLWLGKSLLASGDRENGTLEILKVPVMYPASEFTAEAYSFAARSYKKFGDIEKTRIMYQELLKSSPSKEQRQEAEKYLKSR